MSNSEKRTSGGGISLLEHLKEASEKQREEAARREAISAIFNGEEIAQEKGEQVIVEVGVDEDKSIASTERLSERKDEEQLELTADEMSILLSLARFGVLGTDFAPRGEKKEYKFGDYMVRHQVKLTLSRIDDKDKRSWRKDNKRNRNGSVIYNQEQIGIVLDEMQLRHENVGNERAIDRELEVIGLVPEVIDFSIEISKTYSRDEIRESYYHFVNKVEQGVPI